MTEIFTISLEPVINWLTSDRPKKLSGSGRVEKCQNCIGGDRPRRTYAAEGSDPSLRVYFYCFSF